MADFKAPRRENSEAHYSAPQEGTRSATRKSAIFNAPAQKALPIDIWNTHRGKNRSSLDILRATSTRSGPTGVR